MITMIAAIIGALGFLAQPGCIRWIAIGLCAIVVLLGSLAVIYQVRRIYQLNIGRERLSELLIEGQRLKKNLPKGSLTAEAKQQANDWYARTEAVVARYLGESHNARLEFQDFRDDPSALEGRIQNCLVTIQQFLSEIGT